MDSISMYKDLKDKHTRQEALLKEEMTEKLTTVDVGNTSEFNVNQDVQVEGRSVSAKTVFMDVYSQEYIERLAQVDAEHITKDENIRRAAILLFKTEKNAENLGKLHDYSTNNTGRNEKTRNTHRKKVHKYAEELIICSGRHRNAIMSCASLSSKAQLTPAERKTLKKDFMKKYKLDLEVIDQEYQMNKNLLLMGGNKDVSEEDSLFRLRYTRYAKAMAANNKGIEMARRYPDLFDEAFFQKQLDKLSAKIKELGETASPALMESKKNYFIESGVRRATRLAEKRAAEKEKREIAEIKEKRGERLQGAIDKYIAKKSANPVEVLWLQENLKLDALVKALTKGKGGDILLKDQPKAGLGAEFFGNFDQAMELFIERFLFDLATEITEEDQRELLRGGIPNEGIDRSVRTQLHPVRKLKNGTYVSAEDAQNDEFNRKYINALKTNDMQARRECIEENLNSFLTYNFNTNNFRADDFFDTDRWKKFMISRMTLGISNLKNDNFAAGSSIRDNKEIARDLLRIHLHGTVKVAGKDWDYTNFAAQLTALYGFHSLHKYNVDPGTGELANDVMCGVPAVMDMLVGELETFWNGYRALQNNEVA